MPQDAEVESPPNTSNIIGQPDRADNGDKRHHAVPDPKIRCRQRQRNSEATQTSKKLAARLIRKSVHCFDGYFGDRGHTRDGQEEHLQCTDCDITK
jgi:hypothetical protein